VYVLLVNVTTISLKVLAEGYNYSRENYTGFFVALLNDERFND